MVYDWIELKQILNDTRADKRTRDISRALAKTSLKAACEYASKLPLRRLAEEPIKRSYE